MPPERAKQLDVTLRLACSRRASVATIQLFEVRPRLTQRKIRMPLTLGTGVFAHYEGQAMILTASHVLDSDYVQKYGLFAGHRLRGFEDLGDFSFVRTASHGDRLSDDEVDMAAVLLDPEIADHLREGGVFESVPLPCSGSSDRLHPPCVHFIHGFPVGLTTTSNGGQHLEPTSISCFLPLHDEANGAWNARLPDSKIDFEYVPQTITDLDGLDRQLPLPEPHGFSGCGVWQVALGETQAPEGEPRMELVGVVHRFNRALGLLRATRLELLCQMLRA